MIKWKVKISGGEMDYLDVADNGNVLVGTREYISVYNKEGRLLFETDKETLKRALKLDNPEISHSVILRNGDLIYLKVSTSVHYILDAILLDITSGAASRVSELSLGVLLGFDPNGRVKLEWRPDSIYSFDVSDESLIGVCYGKDLLEEYYGLFDSSGDILWQKETEHTGRVFISKNGKYVGFLTDKKIGEYKFPVVRVYNAVGKLKWEWSGEDHELILPEKMILLNDSSAIILFSYSENNEWFDKLIFLRNGDVEWEIEGKSLELLDASPNGETIIIVRKDKTLVLDRKGNPQEDI